MREGTPLASRVAQGVSGPSSSCVWNPRVFADDARGWCLVEAYICLLNYTPWMVPGIGFSALSLWVRVHPCQGPLLTHFSRENEKGRQRETVRKCQMGFPGGASGKKKTCLPMQEMQEMQVRSLAGRSPGERHGNPL